MPENIEISVVVQGAVSAQYTPICLRSIRTTLPQAEIILSTWQGTDTSGLDYDKLVVSDDPGAEIMDTATGVYNNINRQLVSTEAGLAVAGRKYCLKFRTDMELLSADFINFFGKFDTKETPAQYFKNRILISNFYTRNPRILPVPFHPSDWIAFGLTEDLKKYYDIPLQDRSEMTWFQTHKKYTRCFLTNLARYVPEQYICLNFIKNNHYAVSCNNYYDASRDNIRQTEKFFADNMVVLDYSDNLGIKFLKYNPDRYGDKHHVLYFHDWMNLYRRYSEKQKGWFWLKYLLENRGKKIIFYNIRSFIISILVFFHLKEYAKSLLEKFKSNTAESNHS